MPVTVAWEDLEILVPRDYGTLVQSTPVEIRSLDTNGLRVDLRGLEASAEGRASPVTHVHNEDVLVGGVSLADVLIITEPYTITFEDGQYAVYLQGTNNNVLEKTNKNQVSVNPSNSAGLVNSEAIEFSEFANGIHVQADSGFSGTINSVGTQRKPVNNFPDGVLIATRRGVSVANIIGNYTLTTGDDVPDFTLIGQSITHTQITVEDGAGVLGSIFKNCTLVGILDGNNHVYDGRIQNLTYLYGYVVRCAVRPGVIELGGGVDAHFDSCWTEIDGSVPIIDCGDTGQSLNLSGYRGAIKIRNQNDPNEKIVVIITGEVELDSTITAGSVTLIGEGTYVNNMPDTVTFDDDGFISKQTISHAVWDEPIVEHIIPDTMGYEMLIGAYKGVVHVHEGGGSGQLYPWGTGSNPVGNFADAIVIANLYKLNILHLDGDLVASGGVDLSGFTIVSDRSHLNSLTVADAITDPTYITDLTVSGIMAGGVRYTTCVLGAIDEFDGGAKNCLITNTIDVVGTGANYLTDCDTYTVNEADSSYKEISVNNSFVNLIRCQGRYEITNKTGDNTTVVNTVGSLIKIAASCTTGIIIIDGIAKVVEDLSGPGCTVIDTCALSKCEITEEVWDVTRADHTIVGTFGAVSEWASSGLDASAIATAVWAAVMDDNDTSGSFGWAVKTGRFWTNTLRDLL